MINLTVSAQNHPKNKVLLPPELKEVSGMAILGKGAAASLYWVNDSHNPPVLYSVPLDRVGRGKALGEVEAQRLPVLNRDWEDLTSDDKGNLYIGDFGSNYNRRRDLRIYIFQPASGKMDSILFTYPDQTAFPPALQRYWNFNCEAFVYFQDSLHLFSKNAFAGNDYTKHYVLPARPGNHTALLKDSIRLSNRVVTGAGISDDGKRLALVTYKFGKKWGFLPYSKTGIWFFDGYQGSNFFRGKKRQQKIRKFLLARQVESVVHFGGKYWLIANERMGFNKQSVRVVSNDDFSID